MRVDEEMKFIGFILMAVFVPDPAKRSSQRKCIESVCSKVHQLLSNCKRNYL